jgi:phage terminase large subunit
VDAGIKALNSKKSVVLRKGDSDLIREMTMYRYREINGVKQEEPVKVNDHCCDAVRSAYFTHNIKDIMRRIDPKNIVSDARSGMRI